MPFAVHVFFFFFFSAQEKKKIKKEIEVDHKKRKLCHKLGKTEDGDP